MEYYGAHRKSIGFDLRVTRLVTWFARHSERGGPCSRHAPWRGGDRHAR